MVHQQKGQLQQFQAVKDFEKGHKMSFLENMYVPAGSSVKDINLLCVRENALDNDMNQYKQLHIDFKREFGCFY